MRLDYRTEKSFRAPRSFKNNFIASFCSINLCLDINFCNLSFVIFNRKILLFLNTKWVLKYHDIVPQFTYNLISIRLQICYLNLLFV